MMLYTIGFTKKTAREFFDRLAREKVSRIVDIRLNNVSQLAGFAKRDDLQYFLEALAGIEYVHEPLLAPTQDLFAQARAGAGEWAGFARAFRAFLRQRRVGSRLRDVVIDRACLLCSEDQPDKCHRSLVADQSKRAWQGVGIVHL